MLDKLQEYSNLWNLRVNTEKTKIMIFERGKSNNFRFYYNDQQLEIVESFKYVTMQNRWNNRISDGCVYAQIRKGLGMHLVTYSNHDTVPFLLIVPIKGRFVWDGIHCVFIYKRLHDFVTFLEDLGDLVHFSLYKGWNFPFLLGDILKIP